MGGWMLATGEMRGDLAKLTRLSVHVPDAVAAPTVVFPVAGRHAHDPRAEEGRRLRPRTVRLP